MVGEQQHDPTPASAPKTGTPGTVRTFWYKNDDGTLRAEERPGVLFDTWAAYESYEDDLGAKVWGVAHIASGVRTSFGCCRDVAIEAARLLDERFPALGKSVFGAIDLTPEERAAFSVAATEIQRKAMQVLPSRRADVFEVDIIRRTTVVVVAENERAAQYAASTCADRGAFDHLLNDAAVHAEASAARAHYVADEVGLCPDAAHSSDRYFHATRGTLYAPNVAPVRLYLDLTPDDHSRRCAESQKTGPCDCLARLFPQDGRE